MSPQPERQAKITTTDGPVSLPRKPTVASPETPQIRRADLTEAPKSKPPSSDGSDKRSTGKAPGNRKQADQPRTGGDNVSGDAPELDVVAKSATTESGDIVDGDQAAPPTADAATDEPQDAPALPSDVLRLQSEMVQGAVRREQHIAEITAAVAQAISKAHREVNQSASELDSLRSMLQSVASADESQSFLEIERVQATIQATQSEWSELNQSRKELEGELLRVWKVVEKHETALDEAQNERVKLETDRNDAERRVQDLFDRLAQARVENDELKGRIDNLAQSEAATAKLETKVRDLTAEKTAVVHQAKTNQAALEQRLSEALEKLAAAQKAQNDDQTALMDPATVDALDRAQADAIKMKAEVDMLQAELAKTKTELEQAFVAETELETKLQSAWTAADEGAADLQTSASDLQQLRRDLSDANKNLDMLRGRLDKAAGERKEALEAADADHQIALEAAQAETQAALDKQARDHQAGVAALKAAQKQKLNRVTEELQEKSTAALAKARAQNADLERQIAAFDQVKQTHAEELAHRDATLAKAKQAHQNELATNEAALESLKKQHAEELAAKDAAATKLRQSHAADLAAKDDEANERDRAHKSRLDAQAAETEQSEERLRKLQATHDGLVAQQAVFEDERKLIAERSKEIEELRALVEAADTRAVEREEELEKLRLSSDDTHQRIGTLLGQIETLQSSLDAQSDHVAELTRRETEYEAEVDRLQKQATSAIEARSKVIKGAESTAMLASQAETRAEQLDRELQQASVERDAVTGALTTAEARIVNLEAELDRITNLADQRVQAAFESATALGERAIADAEAKEQRIHELEAQLSLLQRRGSGIS